MCRKRIGKDNLGWSDRTGQIEPEVRLILTEFGIKPQLGQGTSRFLAQGGGGLMPPLALPRGAFWIQGGASRFFTNNMILLECGVIFIWSFLYV